jgi:hypothetical protein
MMPIEHVPETNQTYYLIAYDAQGNERSDDPDGLMSQRVLEVLRNEPITDVFLQSHGWQADLASARDQYNRWISAMAQCTDDLQRVYQTQPAFRPLLIGLHWPSLPWGDEALGGPVSFTTGEETSVQQDQVEQYAQRLAPTARAREALTTLLNTAMATPAPATLPETAQEAYSVLVEETGLECAGVGAAPGADLRDFDAEGIFYAAQQQSFAPGGRFTGALLAPLRVLSFWKMKARANRFGEHGGFTLLRELQRVPTEGEPVRFHLMGHSFGCIVVSACLAGPGGQGALERPVESVALVQGAFSLWSYCQEIPRVPGEHGYFHPLIAQQKLAGPLVTTQSIWDDAVGHFYPLGAGIAQQVSYDIQDSGAPQVNYTPEQLPTYGAVGAFGLQGPGLEIVNRSLMPRDGAYHFTPGTIYNLDCSQVIRKQVGFEGAHGDFLHPEVAHVVWQVAYPG